MPPEHSAWRASPRLNSAAVVTPQMQAFAATAALYLGLTRGDPALLLRSVATPFLQENQATLEATVTGGTYPQPANDFTTNLYFASPQAQQIFTLTGAIGATNSLAVSWYGPSSPTTSGTLYGLQVQSDDSGLPIAYPGYGATDTSVTNAVVTNASLAFNPVTSAVLTGSVTVPPGFSVVFIEGHSSSPRCCRWLPSSSWTPRSPRRFPTRCRPSLERLWE